jgi:hypothetical protein
MSLLGRQPATEWNRLGNLEIHRHTLEESQGPDPSGVPCELLSCVDDPRTARFGDLRAAR